MNKDIYIYIYIYIKILKVLDWNQDRTTEKTQLTQQQTIRSSELIHTYIHKYSKVAAVL